MGKTVIGMCLSNLKAFRSSRRAGEPWGRRKGSNPRLSFRLDQERRVTALENMPVLPAEPVETVGKRALKPAHAIDQVARRCLQKEVIVVAHEDIRMEHPPRLRSRLRQTTQKRLPGSGVSEDIVAVIPAINHMVTGSGVLNAQFSRHAPSLERPRFSVNIRH